MANNSANYGPEIAGGIFEVASHALGRKVIDSLRKNFTSNGKMRSGDFYMNQSREILQSHLQIIGLEDQSTIRLKFTDAIDAKERLDATSASGFQRFLLAMDYRRLSKHTFMVIQRASNRAVNDSLLRQMGEAIHETGNPPSASETFQSIPRNPFTDSHAVSTLSDVSTGDLGRVEVESYQSEVTGEGAVVFELHRLDASTQHLVANFPPTVFSGDNTDRVETHTISSVNASGIFGPPSVMEEAQ